MTKVDDFKKETIKINSDFLRSNGFKTLADIYTYVEICGPFKYLVVLGSGMTPEFAPNKIFKVNFWSGIILKSLGLVEDIVITGGKTVDENGISESESAYQYLYDKEIPNLFNFISIERESLTTIQNAEFTVDMLHARKGPTGMVASPYHLKRAKSLFDEVYSEHNKQMDKAMPSSKILEEFNLLVSRFGFYLNPQSDPLLAKLLSTEMIVEREKVFEDFRDLPLLDPGAALKQLIVRLCYKTPYVKDLVENQGRQRGKHKKIAVES